MRALSLVLVLSCSVWHSGESAGLFFPIRKGRATSVPVVTNMEEPLTEASMGGQLSASSDKDQLISSLLEAILPKVPSSQQQQQAFPDDVADSFSWDDYNTKYSYERRPTGAIPRGVDGTQTRQFTNVAPPVMNLLEQQLTAQLRQDPGSDDASGAGDAGDDEEIRCIPKVMQVEETVYDRSVRCTHSYHEKCHMTYITDYVSTTEEKCETTFVKECHITFKPMPFDEKVDVCHTPLERQCGSEPVGPEICSTHYETSCETKYTSYEVEQDEPTCTMEIVQKCENITLPLPPSSSASGRQFDDSEDSTEASADGGDDSDAGGDGGSSGGEGSGSVTLEQHCEDWPVQKCTVEKKTVSKVKPETACKKIPREVCIPNNCHMETGEEVCKEETRVLIQNVPQEDCELQPEENCYQEAVMVPKLVQTPNCVKVPKEVCVNTKNNPRRVKKPVVKEWCYRPKDLIENRDSFPLDILAADQERTQSL